ncbi:uncharacterized protein LOC118503814 [Anopheles stephensi]|nr:uncharacterized protein LOC118503814 [Anopheles stephensi]
MLAVRMWKVSLVYLFAICLPVSATRMFKVIPTVKRVDLRDNLQYLNSSAQVYAGTENKVDFSIDLKKPLIDPWLNIMLYIDVGTGGLKAPLQNKSFNFCKFLRNPSMHRFGQILLREVKRRGNAPKKCPFPAKLYQFRGISMDALRMPGFFPENDFYMDLYVGVGNELVYDSRWHGMLKRITCKANTRC